MENLKFYHVEVGSYSRKGNLTVHNSFICKSDLKKELVKNHYLERYHGFGVIVSEVMDIVEHEIINKASNVNNEEINNLKKELADLKNKDRRRIQNSIHKNSLNKDLLSSFDEMLVFYEKYKNLQIKFTKELRDFLEIKYAPFYSEIIINKQITAENYNCEYTVNLKGQFV